MRAHGHDAAEQACSCRSRRRRQADRDSSRRRPPNQSAITSPTSTGHALMAHHDAVEGGRGEICGTPPACRTPSLRLARPGGRIERYKDVMSLKREAALFHPAEEEVDIKSSARQGAWLGWARPPRWSKTTVAAGIARHGTLLCARNVDREIYQRVGLRPRPRADRKRLRTWPSRADFVQCVAQAFTLEVIPCSVSCEQARKFAFDWRDRPLLRVRPGESFEVETWDAGGSWPWALPGDLAIWPSSRLLDHRHPAARHRSAGQSTQARRTRRPRWWSASGSGGADYSWVAVGPRYPLGRSTRRSRNCPVEPRRIFHRSPGAPSSTTRQHDALQQCLCHSPILPFVGTLGIAQTW